MLILEMITNLHGNRQFKELVESLFILYLAISGTLNTTETH